MSIFLQHTSLSPDGKLVVIVGDNPEGLVVDSNTGKVSLLFCSSISWISISISHKDYVS